MNAPSTPSAESLVLAIPPLYPERNPLLGPDILPLLETAATTGFQGVSLCTSHPGWGIADDDDVQRVLSEVRAGLPVASNECMDCDLNGLVDPKELHDRVTRVLDQTALIGAATLNVIELTSELASLPDAARRLAAIADQAADRGVALNFEFLPWTAVHDIDGTVRLLEATDRENVGILLDAWHWVRAPGGPNLDAVLRCPPELISLVQIDDAPAAPAPDLVVETMSGRLLPGDGDVDLLGLLGALDEIGATPAFSLEIFSTDLARLGHVENARRQHDATRALFARHRANRAGVQAAGDSPAATSASATFGA